MVALVEYYHLVCVLLYDTNVFVKHFTVDCTWGVWSTWQGCSVTCGGGTQERNRSIDVPAQNGGRSCTGSNADSQDCNTNGCPGIVLHFSLCPFI